MLCCQECNVRTEITTTVVLQPIEQQSVSKQMVEKMMRRKKRVESCKDGQGEYRFKKLLNLDKENQHQNVEENDAKTRRKEGMVTESILLEGSIENREVQETGRFNVDKSRKTRRRVSESFTKKIQDSKVTSLGSASISQKSSAIYYKQRELESLQAEHHRLKEQELTIMKEKLVKEWMYQKELVQIRHLKEDLKAKNKERKDELQQIKELFSQYKSQAKSAAQ